MRTLYANVRIALRALGRRPGFTGAAVGTLAIGIGANVAIFSVVDEIWLRPMPVPQADRLVRIFTSNPSSEGVVTRGFSSYPDFESVRRTAKSLAGVAALERRGAQLDTGSESKLVTAAVVSGNFFDVLAPLPTHGRAFGEQETEAPGGRVAMLSHPFWRRQFGADPTLPGRTIILDRQEVLVAGILPRGFRGTEPMSVPDVWLPLATWVELTGDRSRPTQRGYRGYELFGRLGADATLEQVNAELAVVAARLEREFPASNAGRRMTAIPESRSRGAAVARLSSTLLGVAALVLILACANVASLLLAHAESRRHELGTRVALGASRRHLIGQLGVETALLALAATATALALGAGLVGLLPRLLPDLGFSAPIDAHLSGRVLLFTLGTAMAAMLGFGLLPAWQVSGTSPATALRGRVGLDEAPRARLRAGLIVAQVALSMVLTVSGGLLIRSLVRAQRVDPGFDAHQNLLVLELVPGFGTSGGERAYVEEARRRLETLPGVLGTAAGMRIPFGLSGGGAVRKVFATDAAPAGPADGVPIHYDPVSDRFFELLGTRILRGRSIGARDVADHARVVVVNQAMAARFWPGRDPLGERLRLDAPNEPAYEVVGVAENSVNTELRRSAVPYLYTPMAANDYGELTLIVTTAGDPAAAAPAVRRTLYELDRNVPIIYLATLSQHMRLATSHLRMTSRLVVTLGGLGLLLVAVGLYGLISFLVARRTREIGIRLALGAAPRSILALVVEGALRLAGAGLALGTLGALVATRALQPFLYGVGPGDPTAYAAAVIVILAVTIVAAFLPSRRATRVDPITALRCE